MSEKLEIIMLTKDAPEPVISNNEWALDILTFDDIYVKYGNEFDITSSFKIKMPDNVMGLILSKSKGDFSIVRGEIVHPNHEGVLELSLRYNRASEDRIPKGTPICQLVLAPIFNLKNKVVISREMF